MQYQTKPQYVEAVQYQGVPPDSNGEALWSDTPDWLVEAMTSQVGEPRKIFVDGNCNANVQTAEGVLLAEPGDYVVLLPGSLGVQACESFEAQYEPTPEPTEAE